MGKRKSRNYVLTLTTILALVFALICGVLLASAKIAVSSNVVIADGPDSEEWEIEGVRGYYGTLAENDGKNITWEYVAQTKTLNFRGEGIIANNYSDVPWSEVVGDIEIVDVGEGIINVGSQLEFGESVSRINLPSTIKFVGQGSFNVGSETPIDIYINATANDFENAGEIEDFFFSLAGSLEIALLAPIPWEGESGFEYVLDEGYVFNEAYVFDPDADVQKACIHFDNSLTTYFNDVFENASDVTYDNTYEVPTASAPGTGVALDIILPVSIIIGSVFALVFVAKKKEQY